jgi:hypothetical protein
MSKKRKNNKKKIKTRKNQPRHLRTVYNSIDVSGFSPGDFQNESALYEQYRLESNRVYPFLSTLPSDNPLVQIIENKRLKYLQLWDSKRIPVGGGRKSDEQILIDFLNLRNEKWKKILIKDANKRKIILWDFSLRDSGVNQYFPEMMDVTTTKGSVLDSLRNQVSFLNDYERKIFKDNYKRIQEDKRTFYGFFQQMVRMCGESHPVANFPSLAAQYIVMESYYDTIKKNNGIENDNFVILDPATGWSGRLVGVLCAFHKLRNDYQRRYGRKLHVTYLTTDPNTDVHERFSALINDWFNWVEPKNSINYFHFHKEILGCETPEFLDFCKRILGELNVSGANVALTSPPYFSQEWYSTDKAQSCEMYPEYQLWVDKFLSGMIKNVHTLLQPKGRFYLNIANTRKGNKRYRSESESVRLLKEHGMREVIIYKLLLSGTGKGENKVIVPGKKPKKFEPVFVYEK